MLLVHTCTSLRTSHCCSSAMASVHEWADCASLDLTRKQTHSVHTFSFFHGSALRLVSSCSRTSRFLRTGPKVEKRVHFFFFFFQQFFLPGRASRSPYPLSRSPSHIRGLSPTSSPTRHLPPSLGALAPAFTPPARTQPSLTRCSDLESAPVSLLRYPLSSLSHVVGRPLCLYLLCRDAREE